MIIDTHAHLTDRRFVGRTAEILREAREANVGRIITVGWDYKSSFEGKEISEKEDDVYFAAGIHPSDSGKIAEGDYEGIEKLLSHPKCVALGEIGLDYHYDFVSREEQKRAFLRQLDIAKRAGLPIAIHCRDAYGDTTDIIRAAAPELHGGVMHCFSGSRETATEFVKMGFYISFSGTLTFKNAHRIAETAAILPRDRIIVETDCPYLAPVPHRGEENRPAFVAFTAQKLAEIWGVTIEEAAQITTANAHRLFTKLK